MTEPHANSQAITETAITEIEDPIVEVEKLNLFYDQTQALFGVDLKVPEKKVTAFIGPSGAVSPPCCAA